MEVEKDTSAAEFDNKEPNAKDPEPAIDAFGRIMPRDTRSRSRSSDSDNETRKPRTHRFSNSPSPKRDNPTTINKPKRPRSASKSPPKTRGKTRSRSKSATKRGPPDKRSPPNKRRREPHDDRRNGSDYRRGNGRTMHHDRRPSFSGHDPRRFGSRGGGVDHRERERARERIERDFHDREQHRDRERDHRDRDFERSRAGGGIGGPGGVGGVGVGVGAGPGSVPGSPPRSRDNELLSYKEFLLQQSDDIEPDEAAKRYAAYETAQRTKLDEKFFAAHREEDWFQEKYLPANVVKQDAERHADIVKAFNSFTTQFRNGKLPFVNLDVEESSSKEADEDGDVSIQDKDDTQNSETKAATATAAATGTGAGVGAGAATSGAAGGTTATSGRDDGREEFVNNCLRIFFISPKATRQSLLSHFAAFPGFVRLILSEPDRFQNWQRTGWVFFETQDQCRFVFLQDSNSKHKFDWGPLKVSANRKTYSKVVAPSFSLHSSLVDKDLVQLERLCKVFDNEKGLQHQNPLFQDDAIRTVVPRVKRLNTLLEYMRAVHFYCYYCAKEFKSAEQLFNECGLVHSRNNSGPKDVPEDSKWVAGIENATTERLNNPLPPVDVFSEIPSRKESEFFQRSMEQFFEKQVDRKGPQKFKCESCEKMFKAPQFVHKHVESKHPEMVEQAKKQAQDKEYFDNFVKDKNRPTEPGERERKTHDDTKGRKFKSKRRDSPYDDRHRRGSPGRGRDRDDWERDRERDRDRDRDRDRERDRDRDRDRMPPMPPYWAVPVIPARGGPPVIMRDIDVSWSRRGGGSGRDREFRPPREPPKTPNTPGGGRQLKNYADLDAPAEEDIVVDYGFSTTIEKTKSEEPQKIVVVDDE